MADAGLAETRDGAAPEGRTVRRRDGAAIRQAILDAALVEFSDHGLSGARVDAMAVIQEAWVSGVSTRRVDDLVQAMGAGRHQ